MTITATQARSSAAPAEGVVAATAASLRARGYHVRRVASGSQRASMAYGAPHVSPVPLTGP